MCQHLAGLHINELAVMYVTLLALVQYATIKQSVNTHFVIDYHYKVFLLTDCFIVV